MKNKHMKAEYDVYNVKTGVVVAVRSSAKAARRKADQLDLEYGAILYDVRLNHKAVL